MSVSSVSSAGSAASVAQARSIAQQASTVAGKDADGDNDGTKVARAAPAKVSPGSTVTVYA